MSEQLAHRGWRRFAVSLLIWGALTVLAGVAGPFGTFDALPFWPRVAYWGVTVGVSVLLNMVAMRVAEHVSGLFWLLVWLGYALILAGLVHSANGLLFAGWGGWAEFRYLLLTIGTVVLVIHVLVRVMSPPTPVSEPLEVVDQTNSFLRKLPLEKRGPLIRLEAQDHYLKVVTEAGEELILMRLGDAIAALDCAGGLQVHRSHWVRAEAVVAHKRLSGRDILHMKDGFDVPVSRGQRPAAQRAGLIPT